MPTAAKLVSLFTLAALGWVLAEIVQMNIADPKDEKVWYAGFIAIGAFVGWAQLGKKVGHPTYKAAFAGMGSVISGFIIAVVLATLFAAYDAMGYHAYRTIDDLLAGLTKNMLTYLSYGRDPELVTFAAIGGALSGIIAEMAHRRWR